MALLGRRVHLPLGAVRITRRRGLPLRFLRIEPVRDGWRLTLEPPMPADDEALRARIEREIAAAPEAWMLWPLLLAAPRA